jgi:hypothetical protein
MNERSRWCRSAKFAGLLLVAVIPLAGCGEGSPTAPSPDPPAGPLAAVEVALAPATSPEGYRHAFYVYVTVRELRGVPIVVSAGVNSRGADYNFPSQSTGPSALAIPAHGVGTMDVLVEHDSDLPCQAGLDVEVRVRAADGLTADFPTAFNCATGYWPL